MLQFFQILLVSSMSFCPDLIRFDPDFILIFEEVWIKSGWNLDKVGKKDFIQILTSFFRNSLYPNFIQIFPHLILIKFG